MRGAGLRGRCRGRRRRRGRGQRPPGGPRGAAESLWEPLGTAGNRWEPRAPARAPGGSAGRGCGSAAGPGGGGPVRRPSARSPSGPACPPPSCSRCSWAPPGRLRFRQQRQVRRRGAARGSRIAAGCPAPCGCSAAGAAQGSAGFPCSVGTARPGSRCGVEAPRADGASFVSGPVSRVPSLPRLPEQARSPCLFVMH